MTKVLIVDDEQVYRRQLELALRPEGYRIETVRDGRSAIDLGTRLRPDVLLTDWMLKDHIHGLHVAQTLHAFLPNIRIVLVTGFPSDDLRMEAESGPNVAWVEKPFDIHTIQEAVRRAVHSRPAASRWLTVAAMQLAEDGSVVFANASARDMLAETRAGPNAGKLSQILPADQLGVLDDAVKEWVAVTPRGRQPTIWHFRTQPLHEDGTRLLAMRRDHEPQFVGEPLIEMLLGLPRQEYNRWPFQSRVLLLDNNALTRKIHLTVLDALGTTCYAVATPVEALRLLEKDHGVRIAVLDLDLPETELREVVRGIRAQRDDVVLVGAGDRRAFAACGIERILDRPWRAADLIDKLGGAEAEL